MMELQKTYSESPAAKELADKLLDRKIRANQVSCGQWTPDIVVYLDGHKLAKCLEADEREGYAWVLASGKNSFNAEPGDFVIDNAVVERLTGHVQIRTKEPSINGISEEEIRHRINETFQPLRVYQVIQ